MTLQEITKIIDEAPNSEWFYQVQTPLTLPSVNFSFTFIGLPALYKFINDQYLGWDTTDSNIKSNFNNSLDFFEQLIRTILQYLNPLVESTNSNRDSMWQSYILQKTYIRKENIFLFNSPEVLFLMNVKRDYPVSYDGAYNFIIGSVNGNSVSTKNNLIGSILAYEFTLKNISQITERRNAEKQSISSLRTNFGKYISENEFFLSNFRKDLSDKLLNHETEFQNILENKSIEFEQEKELNAKAFKIWFLQSENEYSTFYSQAQLKKEELQKTYSEVLKFQEPAKYWQKRSTDLKDQAWKTLWILVAIVSITAIFLGLILWFSPDTILTSWYKEDKSPAIRWSLLFISLLSLIAFTVKSISKIMFSSFHLARDCDERYTLTYFYLSLVNDSKLDPTDRTLVIQSLFSRSDTGLLKEDSSPTMPGGLIGNVLNPVK